MNTKINGQLWIDKNSPYKLKYTANGAVYEMDTAIEYVIGGDETFEIGSLLAFSDEIDSNNVPCIVRKARFPEDLDNIIGIAGNRVTAEERNLSIMRSGVVSMNIDLAKSLLMTASFASVKIGDPVYWYIGNYESSENSYAFTYNVNNAGKLTLKTPAQSADSEDKTFNVGYDNLPLIGNIYGISSDEIKIFVNLSKFDTSLEWNWPLNDAQSLWDTEEGSIKVRHGLLNSKANCVCHVVATDIDTGKTFNVSTNVINNKSDDQYTEVYLGNEFDKYKYKITGSVNYKF